MKDEDIDFGKYYELDCNRKYFSIDLQREVQFDGVLAVKPTHKSDSACGNFNGGCLWFGTLVDVDVNRLHDYDTNNEVEFVSEDVISEYEFNDKILPLFVPITIEKDSLDFLNEQLGTSYESLDDVDWYYVSGYYRLSESFIREFHDLVKWYCISKHQKLSEDFIREFKVKMDWYMISEYQKLSEDFIREFRDSVDWVNVSKYQKLSEDFIREFKNKVDWYCISKYQKLSEDFIREFRDSVDLNSIANNWIYKDTEFLKRQVEGTGLYECHDDYFIAYKGIRSDRYSKYNFQYQYLPGGTYESFCDCSPDEDSFGLSVWTEEKAKKYCDELIVKVKVRYEDVGRVVHDGGKIRCRRITILD